MEELEFWLTHSRAQYRDRSKPMVSLCYAQSLDGSLTLRRGQPTRLSGPESGMLTHQLRAAHEAILVGVGTVLADNPRLTVRLAKGNHPQPLVLDSNLRIPVNSDLLTRHPLKPWIATTSESPAEKRAALEAAGARLLILPANSDGRVDLSALLARLAALGIGSLMVEGGAQVITSFLKEELVDRAILTIAPVFLGGLPVVEPGMAGSDAGRFPRLEEVGCRRLGKDLIIWGKVVYREVI